MDRREDVQQPLGQDALDGCPVTVTPCIDAWYQLGATTNLDDPTTMRK